MSQTTKRSYSLVELLRVFAILGVIWFHIDGVPHRTVAFSGLIIFVMLTSFFSCLSAERDTLLAFSVKRAGRLLIPWLIWYFVYLSLNLMVGKPAFPRSDNLFTNILVGPWIGLWYLPFALLTSYISYLASATIPLLRSAMGFYALLLLSIFLLFLSGFVRNSIVLSPPWAQWVHAIPAISFGVAAYSYTAGPGARLRFILFVLSPVAYLALSASADLGLALSYIIAVPATMLALSGSPTSLKRVTVISTLVMGVYVLHGIIVPLLDHTVGQSLSPLAFFVVTALLSFAAAYAFKRVPILRSAI